MEKSLKEFASAAEVPALEAFVTIEEAAAIFAERGEPMSASWIRTKAASGQIPDAERVGGAVWLIPRRWAERYVKKKTGRPRKPLFG